ncbi:hypothetical protein ACLVWU_02490 [Bdellovibrio sp. HCB290]|uniref:hypothetical protein n=1 Tax=Bdellovibrio sp. HCB290 TaxID=3394356 RepID=UPI0039B483C3
MKKNLQRVVLAAIVASTLSCMKTPDLEDKSIPATAEEVAGALVTSWGVVEPLQMLKGDFILQETDQQIDTMNPRLVLQEGTTISSITEPPDDPTVFKYEFLYQTAVITGDNSSQSTRKQYRTVSKESDLTAKSTALATTKSVLAKKSDITAKADDYELTLGFERVLMLAYACVMTDDLQKYCKENLKLDSCEIKCGNLTSVTEVRPAPDLIKKQPHCGGIPNCELNVKKVTFDWSILMKTGTAVEKQKVTYSISVTQDLPFFARVLDYCNRGLVQIPDSSKVLVTVCNRLTNFQRTGSQN